MSWKFTNKAATETEPEAVELRIGGDIVDDGDAWLYEWYKEPHTAPNAFRNELKKYDGKPVTVWIDSYGGNVFAAAGIYNALKEHKGGVTVKIDGKAMSAASVIAMAGDDVQMSPVGIMMIHNPLTYVEGDMRDMRKMADVLDSVKETIINAYAAKTKKSRNKISEMMDDETWMSAQQAVKSGFADAVIGATGTSELVEMVFCRNKIMNSTTESIKAMLENEKKSRESTNALKAKLALALEIN